MKRFKPPQLDIDPNIALGHAENWAREKLFAHEAKEEASVEPLPYQRKLIRGFFSGIAARFRLWRSGRVSPPAASRSRA
jgi:hypothetical protein